MDVVNCRLIAWFITPGTPGRTNAVVDRMCSSIREFGLKIPVLARSDGESSMGTCA
jgi:hypothetical protein